MQVLNSYILLIEAYSARLQDMQLNASPAVFSMTCKAAKYQ